MITSGKNKTNLRKIFSGKAIQSYINHFEEAVRNFDIVKEEERQQVNLLIRKRFSGMI